MSGEGEDSQRFPTEQIIGKLSAGRLDHRLIGPDDLPRFDRAVFAAHVPIRRVPPAAIAAD